MDAETARLALVEEEDTDDPVVQTIPVYLSKGLAGQLMLYQYPRGPITSQVDTDEASVIKSRIKPKQKKVELHVEMALNSRNFDVKRAEDIAQHSDGLNVDETESRNFPSSIMDHQVFSSTPAVMQGASRYAVGLIHDGAVHLSPLHSIVHLKPSFGYLDRTDKRAEDEKKVLADGDDSAEEKDTAKQVTVRFARQDTERIKKIQAKSLSAQLRRKAEEPWCDTEYYPACSQESQLERLRLICGEPQASAGTLNIPAQEYLPCLCPPETEGDLAKPRLPDGVVSADSLRKLPLLEQVTLLMKNVKLIPFTRLLSLLGPEQSESVLKTVENVAVLVQGNWVVRSDILYPKKTFSDSGIKAKVMCKARDQILNLFKQNRFVERKAVADCVVLPAENTKELLLQIARPRKDKIWELLLPTDQDFLDRHPKLVEKLQRQEEAKLKLLGERENAASSSDEESSELNLLNKKPIKQQRKPRAKRAKTQRDSISSDTDTGTI